MLAPEEIRSNYYEFSQSVIMALQGDDNTWTVDEETDKFYNAKTVSEVFSSVGVTTTSPSYEPRELEEVEFLSSSFSCFIAGKCVYNLDPEKLIESLKWTSHPGNVTNTLIRVAAMLRVCWPDSEMREICRDLVDFIIQKYDAVMGNDREWILSKAQVLSDLEYSFFYIGYGGPSKFSHIKRDTQIYTSMIQKKDMLESNKIVEVELTPQARKGRKKKNSAKRAAKKEVRKIMRNQPKKSKKKGSKRRRGGMMNVTSQSGMVPVGIASSGITGPRFKINKSYKGMDAIYVQGHERVGTVNVGAGGVVEGTALINQLVSPELIGARLPQYARLYDRYCFTKMTFKYVPMISAANTAANGGVILAIEYDPNDPIPIASQPGMNEAFSWEFSEMNAIYSMGCINAKNIAPKKDYYIDTNNPSDQRFSKQARFYAFANGPLAQGNYGYIIFEYAVHLFVPQMNNLGGIIGGRVVAGASSTPANVLAVGTLDAQSEGVTFNSTTGVLTFTRDANVFMSIVGSGTGFGAFDLPAGWSAGGNVTNAAATSNMRSFFKFVIAGETLGPLTATATTVTSVTLRFATAPLGGLDFSMPKKRDVPDIEDIYEQILKRLAKTKLDQGFVKLPRISSTGKKKVVEIASDED